MLDTLVLSTTYRCPVECDYCGLDCNPRRKEQMSLSFMKKMIDEACIFPTVRHVTFTGGEPLLLKDDIVAALEHVKQRRLTTRIVTNGFWGRTARQADKWVAELRDAGLTEFNISVDDMHQAHIPLQHVKNVHDACRKHGVRILIANKAYRNAKITPEFLASYFDQPLVDFQSVTDIAPSERPNSFIYSTGCMVPAGPRKDDLTEADLDYHNDPMSCRCKCDSVLKDIVITPDKRLNVCCGVTSNSIPELCFDGVEQRGIAKTLKQADDDLIINWLALEGPYGIAKYAMAKDSSLSFEGRYAGPCHLCREVLTHPRVRQLLRTLDRSKVNELIFKRIGYDKMRTEPHFAKQFFAQPTV